MMAATGLDVLGGVVLCGILGTFGLVALLTVVANFTCETIGVSIQAVTVVVVGAALVAWSTTVLVKYVLAFVLPPRLDGSGRSLRVRVATRWFRRSDAWLDKEEIGEVTLRPWQHGQLQVWIVLDSGARFRVSEPLRAGPARLLTAKLEQLVCSREVDPRAPIPRAHLVR